MATDWLVSAAAYGGSYDKPISGVLHHRLGHDPAERLDKLRENWLNPIDLVIKEPEVMSSLPDRNVPASAQAFQILKDRTLTNLYNEQPTWLINAHKALDVAVAAAYGWDQDLSDGEVLSRLLDLNLQLSANKSDGR